MYKDFFAFLNRHQSFILCSHDPADADGLGAELALSCILKALGKEFHIINASPIPSNFAFMDEEHIVDFWNKETHDHLPEKSAMLILDTSDEYNIGKQRELLDRVREVYILDHHEPPPQSSLKGHIDSKAASTSELAVEIAAEANVSLDLKSATAAYTGIVYDTGYFAYSKTSSRTFAAALKLVDTGVAPYQVYNNLSESASTGALLLQKLVFSTMEMHAGGKIAVQVLRKEALEETGANFEDAESFVNMPLKSRDVSVSILVKENLQGNVRFSIRSKGSINVSKIAQTFGGGGHVAASGFKCPAGIKDAMENILRQVIEKVELQL